MDALGKFIFSSGREARPLQPLSAERVNAARPAGGTTSTTTTDTTKTASDPEAYDVRSSPQSSPIRRAKADLFADYHPTNGSPKAASCFSLPQSPSLPEFHALRAHVRTSSDVQGLVKRFEHLDVRDRDAESAERRKKHEAELRRAQIAREEAESDVKKLREEVRQLEKELDSGREKERKVSKRLEVVMVSDKSAQNKLQLVNMLQDDFAAAKDAHAAQLATYDKELRKARKEAFKSSSAVLKLQEELKATRNTLRSNQSNWDLDKQKLQQKEQQRFEMEYQFVSVQEQVEKLTQQLKAVMSEKEALKLTIPNDDVVRVATNGLIALPASQEREDHLMLSPRRAMQSPLSDDKENMDVTTKKTLEARRLAEELNRERIQREHAEELADFLRMECLFKCCLGRHTDSNSSSDPRLLLDAELAAGVEKIKRDMEAILTPPLVFEEDNMELEITRVEEVTMAEALPIAEHTQPVLVLSELSKTASEETPPTDSSPNDQLQQEAERAFYDTSPTPTLEQRRDSPVEISRTIPLQLASPVTPMCEDHAATPFRQQPSIRTVTTTTTVPMHFTPISKPPLLPFSNPVDHSSGDAECAIDESGPLVAQTFDRAAALAAIEYRRGRARSIANGHATPRKQMLEGVKERRDISAPALGQKSAVESANVRSGSASRRR